MAEPTQKPNEIKVEISPEVAKGNYSNLAMVVFSPNEFYMDFIAAVPGMPKANVQTRVIMTPENAKNLLFALRDSLTKYENTFGEIERKMPINAPGNKDPYSA